jgi:hypothetical protein
MTLQPRVVKTIFAPFTARPDALHTHKYVSTTPTILHVHHESREEGLRYYKISRQDDPNAMNQFYFSPTTDTLDMGSPSWYQWAFFFSHNECGLLNQVQRITAELGLLRARHTEVAELLAGSYPALREITVLELLDEETCVCPQTIDTKSECLYRTLSIEDLLGGPVARERRFAMELRRAENKEVGTFYDSWKRSTDLPCPLMWNVDICINSRYFIPLEMEKVNRFVDARASGTN